MMERRIFLWMGLMVLFLSLGLCGNGFAEVQYKVKRGDTLTAIAKKHNVDIQSIRDANRIQGSSIHLGQNLVIPSGTRKAAAKAEKKVSAKVSQKKPASKNTYIVKKGDSLQSIAKKTGVSMALLKETNNLRSPKLKIGQTLNLPGSSAASESAPLVLAKKEADKPTARAYDEEEDLLDEGTPAPITNEIHREAESSAILLGKWRGPEERSLFVKVAKGFLGAPYRFGGSSIRGLDCSAFVAKIYQLFDVTLPRTAREQAHVGMRVSRGDLQEGDLVFFNTRRAFGHVGIYIGNNQFVHAASGKKDRQVKIDSLDKPYYNQRFIKAVRLKDVEKGDDNT